MLDKIMWNAGDLNNLVVDYSTAEFITGTGLSVPEFNDVISFLNETNTINTWLINHHVPELDLLNIYLAQNNYGISIKDTDTNLVGRVISTMSSTSEKKITINLLNITKTITTIFDAVNSDEFSINVNGIVTSTKLYRISMLEIGLTQNRYHKIHVNIIPAGDKHIVNIVTNQQLTYATIRKLLAALPMFIKCPDDVAVLLKTFALPTAEETFALLHNKYDLKKILTDKNNVLLDKVISNLGATITRNARNNLEGARATIRKLLTDLTKAYADEHTWLTQIQGMEDRESKVATELREYLSNNKSMYNVTAHTDSNMLSFIVASQVTNYDIDEATTVLSKERSALVPLGESKAYRTLLSQIFIEQKYTLVFKTHFNIYLNSLRSGRNCVECSTVDYARCGNPHLTKYNCYGGYAGDLSKALINGDLVNALCLICASTSNINFLDSTVMDDLHSQLKNYGQDHIVIAEDGTQHTFAELLDKISKEEAV